MYLQTVQGIHDIVHTHLKVGSAQPPLPLNLQFAAQWLSSVYQSALPASALLLVALSNRFVGRRRLRRSPLSLLGC